MSGSGVSIGEIRTSLGAIDDSYIPDDTILQAIEFAQVEVDDAARDQRSVSAQKKRIAVIAKARRQAFMSIPPEERIQAVDATVQYDIESFLEELRYREEHTMDMITGSGKASFRSPRSR